MLESFLSKHRKTKGRGEERSRSHLSFWCRGLVSLLVVGSVETSPVLPKPQGDFRGDGLLTTINWIPAKGPLGVSVSNRSNWTESRGSNGCRKRDLVNNSVCWTSLTNVDVKGFRYSFSSLNSPFLRLVFRIFLFDSLFYRCPRNFSSLSKDL